MNNCSACGESRAQDLVECQSCGELLVDIFGSGKAPASEPGPNEAPLPGEGTDSPGSLEDVLESATLAGMTRVLPRLTRFGNRYEIIELIGEGGMGRVYKARDLELDREIALKIIRGESSGDPSVLKRFKQELLLARRITHKNVVRIYDLGEARGIKFFTMELIDGESLKDVIRKEGAIPVEKVLSMLPPMLSALGEAHEQEVIHRDLKPQNIMVSRDGMPHIMDFGIARSAESSGMTATGSVLGTPDYIAPEQVEGEKTNAQSDLFSFGVVLYEMLTGRVPYEADTAVGKVMMRLTQAPPSPRDLNSEIPVYLENIVLKCLEVDPALRYKCAGDVLEDLEREQVDRSWTMRVRRALVRRRASLATAAAMLTAVVGTGAYVSRGPAAPTSDVGQQESMTTVAVLPFVNTTGLEELDWMRTGLAEMLITDISQSRYVRPVPGERIFKLLRQLEIDKQSRFDEAALDSVAELAPADSILYGQFVQVGGRIRMDLTLRKTGSGVPTPIKAEADASKLLALVDGVTEQIKEHLDLTPEQLKGDSDRPIADVATASIDALRVYQAGLMQLRQGANQAAIPLLREAVEGDANFAMAHAKLAEAYLNIGTPKEAKTAIDRAQTLSEASPLPIAERYQVHAIAALVNDDYETAAKSYGELAKLYPNDPDIHLSRARALADGGRLSESLEAYLRVVQLAPDYGAALLGLARVQLFTGQPDEAIRSAEGALASSQFQSDLETMGLIHSILGIGHRETGRFDESEEHLTLSLDFRRQAGDERGEATTLTNLAAIYEQRGQIDRALMAEGQALAIARAIGNRTQESLTLYNMGLTYKVAGRLDEALQAFRDSLQIEMDRGDYMELAIRLGQIADTYRVRGQYADAVVYLEQAKIHLEHSGDKLEKAYNLTYIGQVKTALGRNDEAIEAFLAALANFQEIQHRQGVAQAQLHVAETYSIAGRYADAHQALQRSLEICDELRVGHDLAEVKARLGHFFVRVGLFEDADRELTESKKAAEEAHADDLMPLILLGRASLDRFVGKPEQAIKACQSAKVQAKRIGQKEIILRSDLELGLIYLEQGQHSQAERLLLLTREDASRIGARPLEAEVSVALAQIYLTRGEAESAYDMAQEAVAMAERFSGRPLLVQAFTTLGQACEELNRTEEAAKAFSQAADTLDWLRGSVLPEHVDRFMKRRGLKAPPAGHIAQATPAEPRLTAASSESR